MMENERDGRKILDRAKRDIITIERGERWWIGFQCVFMFSLHYCNVPGPLN